MTRPTVTDDAIPKSNLSRTRYYFHELLTKKCYKYPIEPSETLHNAQNRLCSALSRYISYHKLDWEYTTRQSYSDGKKHISVWRTK